MKNLSSVENMVMDRLNENFLSEFEYVYKNIKIPDKTCVLKYVSHLFRKWFYSTLIDDTVITPCSIAEYGGKINSVYPIIKNKSISRLGSISINNVEYSLDNHPICNDFRIIINRFMSGVPLDFNMSMDFEDIKKCKNLSDFDSNYITYIIMLGFDLGYIEKMSSVGVEMYCASKKSTELKDISNRELLNLLVKTAVKITVTYLYDGFFGETCNINEDMVYSWLKKPVTIDKIFESVYGDLDLGIADDIAFEDMEDFEREITAKMYARGMDIDKWFITPFGYYFRFIDSTYMYEFSFYDEIVFLINAITTYEAIEDELVIDSAIYSPCTLYKISRLGAEFFNIEYDLSVPYIFKNMGSDNVLNAALGIDLEERNKILNVYKSEFNIADLKVTDLEGGPLGCVFQAREDITLDKLSDFLLKVFHINPFQCKSYRFYKLPESPFTEYTPAFMEKRGPHTEDFTLNALLEVGDECYYEVVFFDDDNDEATFDLKIQLSSIKKNEDNIDYPILKDIFSTN